MWQRFSLLILFVVLPYTGHAQVGDFQSLTVGGQQPSITLQPALPSPGETFTATIEDYSGTLFGSQITWVYNGEVLTDGANQRSVELTAGAAGSNQQLRAELTTPNQNTVTVGTTVSPLFMDIILEPQTRVPDWYKGRALPSYTSVVNATLLLHNGSQFLNANNIVYTWQVDQQVLEGGPIRGGNKVTFETPRGGSPVITVSASTIDGVALAKRAVQMNSVLPDIAYYEKHSLYGSKQQPVLSAISAIGNVLTLQAEPFNLDTRVYNNPDIAQWEINRIDTDNGVANPYEITLSRAGTGGRTLLNFHVRSLSEVLQGAEDSIAVNF